MRLPAILLALALLISMPLTVLTTKAQAQSGDTVFEISEIAISGNRRVASGTVLSYLPISVGDSVNRGALSNALERLYETDLFRDIDIDLVDGVLIVNVEENPIINRVNIEGNDAIPDDRLIDFIDIQPRRVYTREVTLAATQRLLDIYQAAGRFAAVVNPQIIELDENRVDLAFVIDEGPLIKIRSINFTGNERFSDRQLRRTISSREGKWWALFAQSDKYDEARLDFDVRLLRQYYLSRGYADINVYRAQGGLLADRTGFAVTFYLDEGERYKVNNVALNSDIPDLDNDALVALMDFGDDGWYDVRVLEQGLFDITNELGSLGYAFVNVEPTIIPDSESSTLDVTINIGRARKNFIERIEIVNNVRTLDSVIRREFELVEGDAFNQLKLDRSIRNIRNLGFFKEVGVENIVGSSEDQTITEITVEEQSTGTFSVGIGYSTIDKTNLVLGLDERNFLGTGRGFKIALDISDRRSTGSIGVSQPYLFGRNLTGRADLFNERLTQDSIDISRTGVDLGIGFSAANDFYHRIGYELSRSRTSGSSTVATSVTGENNRSIRKSSVRYTVGQDKRDNRFDPSEGTLLELSQEYAGLGGDTKFYKVEVEGGYYKPLLFNSITLGLKGRVGVVRGLGQNVTQSQRFFLGGRHVRGFGSSGIGPRDIGSNAAVGGNKIVNGTVEVISAIGFSRDLGLRWTAYSDFGATWETDYPEGVIGEDLSALRASVGVGLLWDTVLGPMSFYWADAFRRASYDRQRVFQFIIGTRF